MTPKTSAQDTRHTENVRRLGIIEDTLVAMDVKLDGHILKDDSSQKAMHECLDLNAATCDRTEEKVRRIQTDTASLVAMAAAVTWFERAMGWAGKVGSGVGVLGGLLYGLHYVVTGHAFHL